MEKYEYYDQRGAARIKEKIDVGSGESLSFECLLLYDDNMIIRCWAEDLIAQFSVEIPSINVYI